MFLLFAFTFPTFSQNTDVGLKTVWYGAKVWVEQEDAKDFAVGENVTFINWGNLLIKNVTRSVYLP